MIIELSINLYFHLSSTCVQVKKLSLALCVMILVISLATVNGQDASSDEDKDSPPMNSGSRSEMSSKSSESEDLEAPASSASTSKPDNNRKANYTEPRFAQLFNTRNRPRDHKVRIPVKYTTRAKPTLPPFIRNPPHLRVTTDEPSTTRAPRTTRSPTVKSTARTTTTTSSSSRSRSRSSANQVASTYDVTTRRPSRKFGDTPPFSGRNTTRTRVRPGGN